MPQISVIIPTHNPDPGRLRRTLAGLAVQTLPTHDWEIVLVDNASTPAVEIEPIADAASLRLRMVREPALGLTSARRRGFTEASAPFVVLVDDDNVLAPDYLEQVLALFSQHPKLGAIGGRSLPEFEVPPPAWVREFDGLLACRDLGDSTRISNGLRNPRSGRNEYPMFAPVGAGMALRRAALQPWIDDPGVGQLPDRRGRELSSSGDNDIILSVMQHDWRVGYSPKLSLIHLIPAGRIDVSYLARLNRSIATSWMQVLSRHDANPWPTIAAWTVPLRQAKAWFTFRAWAGPAEYVRWRGACGHFEGRCR